jgi:CheY-like chemotaxis protein
MTKKHLDPLGRMLLRRNVLDEDALADLLEQQRRPLPLGSMCYVLGLASEDELVGALAKQRGMPGIVLERSIIRVEVLRDIPKHVVFRHNLLPVREDDAHVFVAVTQPLDATLLNEVQFLTGRALVQHVALDIAIARASRQCWATRERGEEWWYGSQMHREPPRDPAGVMHVISDVDELPSDVVRSTTGQMKFSPHSPEAQAAAEDFDSPTDIGEVPHARNEGEPARILVVDDDFATRHLLAKLLEPAGYQVEAAASGMEAIKRLKAEPPDLVIIDVMLPEINGFQICRSIKRSYKYQHIPVVLISAVIDSAKVSSELLQKYSADAYFEKPIQTAPLVRKVGELLGRPRPKPQRVSGSDDDSFERALALYRGGRLDEAIALLRTGLTVDPLSTRHHFVLANLLQRKNELYEAIDEYEATVHLKPDYFPALSRLAYLYYKQGFAAKAIETWRKALPHCPDPAIRANIETFMRKLATQMASEV